jgi:hypothetical protein
MSCKATTEVQSLIVVCRRDESRKACAVRAKRWARDHRFASAKVDCTANTCRVRQRSPRIYCRGTFRTITLRKGVKAVIAKRRI